MADSTSSDGSEAARSGRHFKRADDGGSRPVPEQASAGSAPGPVPSGPSLGQQGSGSSSAEYYYIKGDSKGQKKHHHHGSRRGLVIGICVVLALVAVVGASAFAFYRSAKTVSADAQSMVSEYSTLSQNLASGDTSSVKESAAKIEDLTTEMSDETSGALWTVAEHLPVVGSDISKVSSLVSISDRLSEKVVTPMAESLDGVSMGAIFSDGKIDVDSLTKVCDVITEVQPEIERAATSVDDLGSASLDMVDEPLQKAKSTLDTINGVTSGLEKIAPSLPSMLGADGARNYLVVAQNNSEIRSTGGFPGSRMLLTVDNGTITMGDFETVGDHFEDGEIPLTDEERAVVTDIMQTGASYAPGDVNAVPSFPRAAQLMEWCWEERGYGDVDGVIAIDPVFLQSMLSLVGGFTTSNGTVVDGTNAAEVLLNTTYFLPADEQDPFFSEVAGLALDKIMGSLGSVNFVDFASTIGDGIEQGRFLIYMSDADEEEAIKALGADGEVNTDPSNPVTGFYIYDKTGSKLDWYLDMRSEVSEATVNEDGTRSYTVTVTLHNTTTLDQMENELPTYITGLTPEVHNYSMITSYLAMAPAGGTITDFQVDADEVNAEQEATLYGNDVWAGYVNIYPSSTATFTYTVTTAANPSSDLEVWTTPTGRSFE